MKLTNLFINKLFLIFSFGTCLWINYLSNALPINGFTPKQLSDLYPNLFVPAGFTFAVWGLIYLFGILSMGFLMFQKSLKLSCVYQSFSIVNALNMSWLLAWHFQLELLSLCIMVLLLTMLSYFYLEIRKPQISPIKYMGLLRVFVSIYLSWICVATIANFTTVLVYYGFRPSDGIQVAFTLVLLFVALAINMLMARKFIDAAFPLVLAWAAFGIFSKNTEQVSVYWVSWAAFLVMVFALMSSAFTLFKERSLLFRSNP
jgi:translocator protein